MPDATLTLGRCAGGVGPVTASRGTRHRGRVDMKMAEGDTVTDL